MIEFIYRAYIPGNFNQVCITNLRGCDDATSMALYVERNSENSASALIQFDREFHEDGCTSRTVLLDDSPESRNFDILVPIHEKSDDGREVRVLVQARNGSNVLTDIDRTFTAQNAGEEAAMYTLSLNAPQNADRLVVNICSPQNNGDSFGAGSVAVSTNFCANPCEMTCPRNVQVSCDDSIDPSNTGEPALDGSSCSTATVTFTDEFDGSNCPNILTRTWRVSSQATQEEACVPSRLVYYDFTSNGRNLCSVNGGDPLQAGAPLTDRNRESCTVSASRVTKQRKSSCVRGPFGNSNDCLLYTSPSPRDRG